MLEALRRQEDTIREVLDVASSSKACLPYAFRKRGLPGYNKGTGTGLAFLTEDSGPAWKYISYGLLSQVIPDSYARDWDSSVQVSRGSGEWEIRSYIWSHFVSAERMLKAQRENLGIDPARKADLERLIVGVILRGADPKLYSAGEARGNRSETIWNASESKIDQSTGIETGVSTLVERGGLATFRVLSVGLRAQVSANPDYSRVGD